MMVARRSGAAAFSLIELLVVVAVIAVLASLMFPLIDGIRERGHAAKCVSNLRGLYFAMNSYASDGGYWPSVNMNSESSSAAEGTQLWFVALTRLGFVETQKMDVDGRLSLVANVFDCPGNTVLATRPFVWTAAPYPVYPDYALNVFWGENITTGSRINNFSMTNPQAILLIDSHVDGSRSIYATDPNHLRWSSGNCKIPVNIHGGKANALLGDGSVTTLSPESHPDIENAKYWNPLL